MGSFSSAQAWSVSRSAEEGEGVAVLVSVSSPFCSHLSGLSRVDSPGTILQSCPEGPGRGETIQAISKSTPEDLTLLVKEFSQTLQILTYLN